LIFNLQCWTIEVCIQGEAVALRGTPETIATHDLAGTFRQDDKMVVALLESASQAIITADRTGRIVLSNRRAEEMFGYTREELMGASLEVLLPESRRAAHRRERDDYFMHPRARPMGMGMDLIARRKDASEFPVEVSLSYIETEQGLFAIGFVTDISRRKALEEQLLQAQKMEAVGRLAGGIAHDFNNMLTVISGYDRMILDELPPTDPLREYAEEILKAAERAGSLTNQLLAFSRRQIIQPRLMNVNAVVGQTEKMLRRLLGEDIQLVFELNAESGNIKADPNQIIQAIVNLAVNARDAMLTGGRIVVETANVHLDENYVRTHLGVQPGDFVMIAMTDTGQGMDAVTRQRIFEPFFTTKEQGKGTGLGLATVYGMVKQAGGDIWVYSEVGSGTTFKLYFPRVHEAISEVTASEVDHRTLGGETVLVVEDENAVRDLTVRMLKQLGYVVLAAASGSEAVAISNAYADRLALLVTDVVMPQMSGRQVADALLAARPDIKVLYLSGYTESTVIHHGVLDSAVDFLPKPFSREALGRKVREILGRPGQSA
jgi:two-component system cell cycle sensor histidine kinase/response regulator CckA